MMRQAIFDEINAERVTQDSQWGGPSHDDGHTLNEWIAIIVRHVGLAASDGGDEVAKRFRRQMIRVAALAVAAVESLDRKNSAEKVAGKFTSGSGY